MLEELLDEDNTTELEELSLVLLEDESEGVAELEETLLELPELLEEESLLELADG